MKQDVLRLIEAVKRISISARRSIIKRKSTVAMLVIMTILLSGAAGFSGIYIAGIVTRVTSALPVTSAPSETNEEIYSSALTNDFNFDSGQLGGYIDDYFTSLDKESVSSIESSLLNKNTGATTGKQLTIPEIAALNSKSVVEIYTESVVSSGRMRQFVTEGAGSGVIVSADGYIITNNHVIEGSRKITVRLSNGGDFEATLIGRDSKTDIAIIKISTSGLQPAVYGNSDLIVVGELAVAIGNPLGQLGGTVTDGIISALSRNIEIDGNMMTLLQTSAAVNPGNSGGGLFNCYGELIGVVNAKSSGSDIEGIGFAIPANLAKDIAQSLITYGYVPGRIDFGATLVDVLDPMTAMLYRLQSTGVYVSQAGEDSQLQSGDRIASINGKEVKSIADINGLLETYKVGDVLSIGIVRSGQTMTVKHTLKQLKT